MASGADGTSSNAGAAYVFEGGPDAKPEGLDAFLAVEGSGWKGEAGTAIEKDPDLVKHIRELEKQYDDELLESPLSDDILDDKGEQQA